MSGEKLYVAYFVMIYEDIWFEFESDVVKRKETSYGLQGQMFISSSLECAYEIALGMVEGMSDANHDGKGNLFKMYSTGINHLEELSVFNNDLRDQLGDMYGIDCGLIEIGRAFNESLQPIVRSKGELLGS